MVRAVTGSASPADAAAVLPSEQLDSLIGQMRKRFTLFGPVSKGSKVVFGPVENGPDLRLDYVTTLLPAKKFFYAPFEVLFRFHRQLGITPQQTPGPEKRALVALHPCEMAALNLLDRVFSTSGYADLEYLRRRRETVVIGLNCTSPGEHCFCTSFETGPEAGEGYDLVLTDLGDRYLIEAATEVGAELLADLKGGRHAAVASGQDLEQKQQRLDAARKAIRQRIPTDRLPRLLKQNVDHPVWEQVQAECLSCGACTVVCPTCYCFNVWDRLNLDLETGERAMVWDSCQFLDFGQVAMGHNFRKERIARVKQRVYHKLSSFHDQYGTFGCVGCGRCTETCLKKISLPDIIGAIGG